MPVEARGLVRKMRGGAQAHLLEASDGCFYVVKFRNNPQHSRILVNEWVASVFLSYLGLSSPASDLVSVSPEFLREHPEVNLQFGSEVRAVEPGWHFGSRFPGDPRKLAVYDFLPDKLLPSVENIPQFSGVLAFDQWAGNADARQSIFFRARIREWLPAFEAHPNRLGFVTQMIDNGYVFGGPDWKIHDSPLRGLYHRPSVYGNIRCLDDFEPWLGRLNNFPEEVIDRAIRQIPSAWMEDSEIELEQLLAQLLRRRSRVADLLLTCRRTRPEWFPLWRE